MRRASHLWAVLALLLPAGVSGVARADEDADQHLDLMDEPITFTDVIDAFDDDDLWDVNLTVGYERMWELGRIQRQDPMASDDRMSDHWNDVSNYERARNQLNLQLDVGIFRDLAAYARLPLVLSDDRSLTGVGPSPSMFTGDGVGGSLFNPTFQSPTRSGVDYFAAGLAWSITNQHRDRNMPTWMIMLEGQFNIGSPMHACGTPAGGMMQCQSTQWDTGDPATRGATPPASDPGIGQGFNYLRAETRASYRYESIEPYAGLAFQIGWPGYSSNQFLPQGNLQGYIDQLPPILGRLTVGAAIIPWEDREHYQRFSVDLRLVGDYVSEGHDYSPLFDALGSSANSYLSNPNLQGVPTASNPTTSGLLSVPFYGLTDVQSHGRFGGTLGLEMRAARQIRFGASAGFLYSPPYALTISDACNPNVSQSAIADDRLAGSCRGGIINPAHRPVIDLPGDRFRITGMTQIDINVWVTAMF